MPAGRRLEVRTLWWFHSVSARRERKERPKNRVALEGPVGGGRCGVSAEVRSVTSAEAVRRISSETLPSLRQMQESGGR